MRLSPYSSAWSWRETCGLPGSCGDRRILGLVVYAISGLGFNDFCVNGPGAFTIGIAAPGHEPVDSDRGQ